MALSLLPRPSIGINVDVGDDADLLDAAVLEELGYDAIWVAGGQLDRLSRIRDLVGVTEQVRVATGVVPLGVHDTAEVAALHADLAEQAPGRFVLGLGGPQQRRALAALDGHLDTLDELGVGRDQRLLAALGPARPRSLAIGPPGRSPCS